MGLIFVDVSVPSSLLSVLMYDSDGRQGDQLSTNGGTGNKSPASPRDHTHSSVITVTTYEGTEQTTIRRIRNCLIQYIILPLGAAEKEKNAGLRI